MSLFAQTGLIGPRGPRRREAGGGSLQGRVCVRWPTCEWRRGGGRKSGPTRRCTTRWSRRFTCAWTVRQCTRGAVWWRVAEWRGGSSAASTQAGVALYVVALTRAACRRAHPGLEREQAPKFPPEPARARCRHKSPLASSPRNPAASGAGTGTGRGAPATPRHATPRHAAPRWRPLTAGAASCAPRRPPEPPLCRWSRLGCLSRRRRLTSTCRSRPG